MFSSETIFPRIKRPRQPGRERRVWVRQKCTVDSSCQPLAAQMGLKWEAETQDIARGGMRLLVRRRFEPGTVLIIEFQPASSGVLSFVTARVVHVSAQDGGSWRVGCRFVTPLAEEELQALL